MALPREKGAIYIQRIFLLSDNGVILKERGEEGGILRKGISIKMYRN